MIKYSLGIDISAQTFDCCISTIDKIQKVSVKSTRKFNNNKQGFICLKDWITKHHKQKDVPLSILMEATGVYYESCALFLYENEFYLSVVLPTKAKRYLQALGLKSKNDKIDAKGLSQMNAEQCLDPWVPADEFYYQLKRLTRQHQALQELKTNVKNQLHAIHNSMYFNDLVVNQLENTIQHLISQIKEMEKAINEHIKSNDSVANKVAGICQIKGVSNLSVTVIIAETNGFHMFKNIKQLVSFVGYDVIENQSGKHNGRTKTSKKGNSRIRRILLMPAFNVVKFKQTPFVNLFDRTYSKHKVKMKSYTAVQKKILVIAYYLFKKDCAYDNGYYTRNSEQETTSLLNFREVLSVESSTNKNIDATQGRNTVKSSQHDSSLLLQN